MKAGDWLHWSKGFSRKDEVLRIAGLTGRPRKDVACTLMEFYEWLDDQTPDGILRAHSVRTLSAAVPDTNDEFWRAVIAVGWLAEFPDRIEIPNFARWMGQTAKRRCAETQRKRNYRATRNTVSHDERDTHGTMVGQSAREKRPRERERVPPNPQRGDRVFTRAKKEEEDKVLAELDRIKRQLEQGLPTPPAPPGKEGGKDA